MNDGEVTIICLVDTLHLPDLGLRLTRGARAAVPMSLAMKSRDLSKAKVDGTVGTQTLRSSVIRAQEHVSSDTVTSQSPRAATVDFSPVLAALQQLTDEVRALRLDIASRPVAPPPVVDLTPLLQQLQGAMVTAKVAPTVPGAVTRTAPVVPTEEMFIPSNLTGGDAAVTLNVASESSDDPGLADTLKALKAARKKR